MFPFYFYSEEIFEKSRGKNSKLKVTFEYSPLQVVNISNDTTEEDFQKNYLEKLNEEDKESAGGIEPGAYLFCVTLDGIYFYLDGM